MDGQNRGVLVTWGWSFVRQAFVSRVVWLCMDQDGCKHPSPAVTCSTKFSVEGTTHHTHHNFVLLFVEEAANGGKKRQTPTWAQIVGASTHTETKKHIRKNFQKQLG